MPSLRTWNQAIFFRPSRIYDSYSRKPGILATSRTTVVTRTPGRSAAKRLSAIARHITEEHSSNGAKAAVAETENIPDSSSSAVRRIDRENKASESSGDRSRINVIAQSRWSDGVPAVMGAHLMASGVVAPLSTSKATGQGIDHLFYYPEEAQENYVVNQYVNADAGAKGLAEIVKDISDAAIKAKGSFTIVLSGGSLLKALGKLVENPGVDWSKWYVAYADERNVSHTSDDSNHKGAKEAFLDKVDIPASQIFALKEGLPVAEASREYEGQLLRISQKVLPRDKKGWPIFDLILLGIGPDGHVASLFPNHKQVSCKEGWILPVDDSPKPPPERISLSLPVINSAANVGIVAFGAGKAEIVQRALEVQSLPGALPAQLVRPSNGSLRWMLDCEAASQLDIAKWSDTKKFPRSQ